MTVRIHPEVDHLFLPGTGPATPAEYARPGHVAAEVVEDIAGWLGGR
ncbi:hypothetical protein [Streptomyces sp. CBMA123]|nr:hypothetical protein [Streptomyces sp. CBMA123]